MESARFDPSDWPLEGRLVHLRLHHPEDAPRVLALLEEDPGILPATGWTRLAEPELRELYRAARPRAERGEEFHWALLDPEPLEVEGSLLLRVEGGTGGIGRLGYWVGAAARGRGVASEAVSLAVDFAFGTLGLRGLFAWVREGNRPSERVLAKNGFRPTRTREGPDGPDGGRRERGWTRLPGNPPVEWGAG